MRQIVLWPGRLRRRGSRQSSDHKVRSSRTKQEADNQSNEVALALPPPALESLLSRLNSEIKENEVNEAHQHQRPSSAHAFQSILAAPLPQGADEMVDIPNDNGNGVLLAAGRNDGQPFTSRDAILLATLADQAALALGNLQYYEMLRGRIDLANSNLRQAYQTLAEERTKLAAAMESNESAVIISDEANRAIFINSASSNILPKAALGELVPGALEQQGFEEFSRLFNALDQKESPVMKAVEEITRFLDRGPQHDPVRHILNAQLTVLTSHEGSRLGTMLVITDVTTQRDLGQMKDDFVSYVAHELRSPLSAIHGYAYLLKSEELEFPEQQRLDMLVSIQDQCNRLNRMVNDMLDISGIEAAQEVQLNRSEIDLVALCEKVLDDQRATIPEGEEIFLSLDCESRPLIIYADADRLEQVLINLISNAIKYSPDGGTVAVNLARSGTASDEIVVSVTDTGMGMTGEQLTRLFEKYYRTPDAQMRGIRGTGLGLHLVKRLVEAHGGRIEVKSEYKQGSTFTVTLPQDGID
jgi:two-component system phosphate regulon sensor histidine kinase PhoR